ncbi:hypothetical protein K6L05_10050 [Salinicoccus roseus]|uniref:polymorphic toxin type 44 domain-containing protein n=1 Tax=Salinicoccus roseus TaxID=45670 RepID=UPI001CA710BA|nr:polymorphic toxin type 44 domain-containing protein [Salinicoccus roseus]MBY8910135.1 hypothetical protein [Salinicoccus roseus]
MGLSLISSVNIFASEKAEINSNSYYSEAIDLNLIEKGNDEELSLKENASESFKENEYNELLEEIQSINLLIQEEIVYVNENFEVFIANSKEISEIVFSNDQNKNSDLNSSEESNIVPYSVNPGHPDLALSSLVRGNRQELENIYNSLLATNPSGAYSGAVGYFVGKVREGGLWDYKVQPGYSPWYKQWYATTFTTRKVVNSEFVGNYNYGFTGQLLFSQSVLLRGGAAVGGNVFTPEDDADRNAIIEGYSHALNYW